MTSGKANQAIAVPRRRRSGDVPTTTDACGLLAGTSGVTLAIGGSIVPGRGRAWHYDPEQRWLTILYSHARPRRWRFLWWASCWLGWRCTCAYAYSSASNRAG